MANADGVSVVAPKQFIVPDVSVVAGNQPTTKGSLFLSGAKLYFYDGTGIKMVTSA